MASDDRRHEQRRVHTEERARLDQISHNYDVWSRRSLAILSVICFIAIAGGLTSAYLFIKIQGARERACLRTNERHDRAIAVLKEGSDQDIANAATQAAKDEIARRRDVTIGLINAIAPRQNCDDI